LSQHRAPATFLLLLLTANCLAQSVVTLPVKPSTSRTVSVEEYRALLERMIAYYESLDADGCCVRPPEVPDEIIVKDGGQTFRLATSFLPVPYYAYGSESAEERAKNRRESGKKNRETVLETLNALRVASLSSASASAASASSTQSKARDVLSRREFRRVRAPGLRETWSDRILRWIGDRLRQLGENTPNMRVVSRALLWGFIAVAVLLVAFIFKRYLEQQEAEVAWKLSGGITPLSAKSWSAWLKDARAAAASGDWRQAVRFGYWAGISALESAGAWRPDRARTPREYLRLMDAKHQHRGTLHTMTQRFERVWYAQQPATQSDFEETVRGLEELGCR
jgi:Domain of unknown function (DUF4129)